MVAASRRGTARILGEPDGKFQWGVLKKATEAAKRVKSPFTYSRLREPRAKCDSSDQVKTFLPPPASPGVKQCVAGGGGGPHGKMEEDPLLV